MTDERKIHLLVNDTDYGSCDDGSSVEILCMDFDWLDTDSPWDGSSNAGGFHWTWDSSEPRANNHASALVSTDPFPVGMVDDDDREAHAKRVCEGVIKMLREQGYEVDYY